MQIKEKDAIFVGTNSKKHNTYMSANIREITAELERCFPPRLQESYDNAGFQVYAGIESIERCLVSLDVTEQVVQDAISKQCGLIVAHHPMIFGRGLMSLTGSTPVERAIQLAIRHQISIYCAHTNADSMPEGTARVMMDRIGISSYGMLKPTPGEAMECGSGAIGMLEAPMDAMAFLMLLKERFQCGGIRHTEISKATVQKIAVCPGSGSFLLGEAIRQGADVFVSGDFTYHKYFEADGRIIIADLGHFETENGIKDVFVGILQKKFINFVVLKSDIDTNPIKYL